jgi:hypothetical protein
VTEYLTPGLVIAAAVYTERRLTRLETKLDGLPCPPACIRREAITAGLLLFCCLAVALVAGCSTTGRLPLLEGQQITTNAVTGTITTQTVYSIAPAYRDALQTVQSVAPAAPEPYGTIIGSAAGLLAVILGFAVRVANRRADRAGTVADTIIDAVETANAPAVKAHIRNVATMRGTEPALAERVAARTKGNPAQ